MSDYTIKKGALGTVVQYACPQCRTPLTSHFSQAGEQDTCPDCGAIFVVPGETEKQQLVEQAAHEKKQRVEEQRRKEIQAAEARQRIEEQRKAREEAAVLAAITVAPPAESPFGSPSAVPPPRHRNQIASEFGEGILEGSFTVARGFSVVVIVLFTVLVCLALFGSLIVHALKRKVEAPPMSTPSQADYESYLASRRTNNDEETNSDGDSAGTLSALLAK